MYVDLAGKLVAVKRGRKGAWMLLSTYTYDKVSLRL